MTTLDQIPPRKRTRSVQAPLPGVLEPVTKLATAIEHLAIDALTPYAGNARNHGQAQITKLAAIIRKVGMQVPLLIDDKNEIIAGHGRLLAAKHIGMTHVPIIRISHLSPDQIKAFRIADNRLAELSSWDDEALAVELKHLVLSIEDPEIIELTSFEIGEVDARIDILEEAPKQDPADEIVALAEGPAVSKLGDVWILGNHRLFCGSSLEEASYGRLLQGAKVRAVWSDPPYNVKIQGHVSGLGKAQHREFEMASGEMDEAGFTAFLLPYLALTKAHSLPGSLHYSCMDALHTFELLTAARTAGLRLKTTCTWAKTNAGMGSLYRQQTEFVHVFKNGDDSVPHLNNIQLGRYGRYRTTLWTYAGVNTFRRGRADDLLAHPTVKPWAMVADAIKDCTAHGESVLDAFCGSGTTIIAAEKVGRIAYGIELDPLYVDVAIRRWQKLTKRRAIHAETGQTFAETECRMSDMTTFKGKSAGEISLTE
ncbi:site-specific DNA-methyltransferase [Mesorhizobium sp. 2RAF45]|uniref:site-specific DNA-methyltransferase n=1 Tax=Mesorhizobium sp. 2RAF45 TaxID=3233001 RepID=UPI003F9E6A9F